MNTPLRTLCIAVTLTVSLSGCGVVRTLGLAPSHHNGSAQAAAGEQFPLTGIGRSQLAGGNFGLAIETFRKALIQGEARAPVLNGLGVGYANVGRSDLAAQYFRLAMEADPQNERYGANLDLLLRNNGIGRMASRDRIQVPASAPADEAPQPAAQALAQPVAPSVVDAPGHLVRLSSREFEIRTIAPAGNPASIRTGSRLASGAAARIALADVPLKVSAPQTVRIDLSRLPNRPDRSKAAQ